MRVQCHKLYNDHNDIYLDFIGKLVLSHHSLFTATSCCLHLNVLNRNWTICQRLGCVSLTVMLYLHVTEWHTVSGIKWCLSDYFKVAQDNHLIIVCTVIKVMKDGFEFVFTPSRPLKLMCNMQWWDSVTIIPVTVYMTVFFTFSIKSPQYTEKYREKNI